jgi:hypothetical protein
LPAGDFVERGHAEVDGGGRYGDLGEFVSYSCETDLEAFGFSVPSFAFRFGDACEEVIADVFESRALGWVGTQHRAADAGLTEMILKAVSGSIRRECSLKVTGENFGL